MSWRTRRKDASPAWGLCPQTPEIYRFRARMAGLIMKALERRTGQRRDATRAPTQAPEWRGRLRPPHRESDPPIHNLLRAKNGLDIGGHFRTTRMYGTSMAAPHVAGVVARILQEGRATSPEGVRTWLRSYANRRGAVPLDSPTGSYTFDGEREGIAVVPSSGAGN